MLCSGTLSAAERLLRFTAVASNEDFGTSFTSVVLSLLPASCDGTLSNAAPCKHLYLRGQSEPGIISSGVCRLCFRAGRREAGVQWTVAGQPTLVLASDVLLRARCVHHVSQEGGFCVGPESILLTLSQINTDTESTKQRNIKGKVWDYPQSLRALHVSLGRIELFFNFVFSACFVKKNTHTV